MATLYVATDGDDGDNGSTLELAKATVEGAIAAAADGDMILVAAGTYTARIYLTAARANGKELLIEPYNGASVTLNSSGANNLILTENAASTKTIKFKGITLDIGTSTAEATIYCLGQKSLTFENCTLCGASVYLIRAVAGTNTNLRVLRFINCTYTSTAATSYAFSVVTGSIYLDQGTYTHRASGALLSPGGAIVVASITGITVNSLYNLVRNYTGTALSAGAIVIEDNTISAIGGYVIHTSGAVDSIKIVDNTIAGDPANATRTTAMVYSAATAIGWFVIRGNTGTDWANGIEVLTRTALTIEDNEITVTKDIGATNGYLLATGPDDWGTVAPETADLGTLARGAHVIGNRIVCTGTGNRHASYLSMQYAGITYKNNRIISLNSDFGLVVKANGGCITGNIIVCGEFGLYLAGATGCHCEKNTIVATDYALAFSAAGRDPIKNCIVNNVFYAPSNKRTISFAALNSTYQNKIDNNMFSHVSILFNSTVYTTLAAIAAAEAAYVQVDGSAMHQHDIWENPAINATTYRVGNRRAYINGIMSPNDYADHMGANQDRKKNIRGLLLPI